MQSNDTTSANDLSSSIVRCMAEAMIFADLEGIIRMWNPGSEALFGFTAEETLGQSLDIIIPEHLREAHWRGYRQAIERGDTLPDRASRITRSLHKTGKQLYVDMSFAMVKDSAGTLIGSMAVARDATQRFQDEKAMRKQLTELTAKTSS
jgi:PAS domain S-box-containing protein